MTSRPRWLAHPLSMLMAHPLAVLFAVALVLLIWRGGLFGSNQPHHAPGSVARAHAAWESNCEACHVPGKTLSGHSWTSAALCQHADSSRCTTCHAGPAHY